LGDATTATEKLLTGLSSSSPPAPYRKTTLYVSTRLGLLFRKAASKDGFRLVDFARILVTLGLTATLLSLDDAWVIGARKRALLGGLGVASKRYYGDRILSRSGVWVAVCLPVGVLALADEFGRSSGLGRNHVLQSFLQIGLATYLKGKRNLLKAIAQVEQPSSS
jgi:hypothetical protein